MATPTQPDAPPSSQKLVTPLTVILFVLGLCVFVPATVILFIAAYPSFAVPGPQRDVRIPVYATLGVLVLFTFLGRGGRAFAAGFGTGLMVLLVATVLRPYPLFGLPADLFGFGELGRVWISPEGTKVREARFDKIAEEHGRESLARARRKWLDMMRTRGMDEARGTLTALLATDCALKYRTQHGQFPADSATFQTGQCYQWLDEISRNDDAWRLRYYPVRKNGSVTGFRLALSPDTVLGFDGPIIESNEAGLVTMRAKRGAPAYVRASPLPAVVNWVIPCLGANIARYTAAGEQAHTLEDLVGRGKISCNIPLSPVDEDHDPTIVHNPNVSRLIVTAPGFERYNTTSVYNLLYAPHGKHQGEGYDLYAWPMDYGNSGVRSYLLAADGSIHVTEVRRRATLSDPLAWVCESDASVPCYEGR
jgi:hypothetical protein